MEHWVNLGRDKLVDTVFDMLFAHFFFLHFVLLLLLVDCRSHRNLGVADGMFCVVRACPASTLRVFVAKCCWQTGQSGEKIFLGRHWKCFLWFARTCRSLARRFAFIQLCCKLACPETSFLKKTKRPFFYRCIQPSSLAHALFLLH